MSAAKKKPEEVEDGPSAPSVELLDLTEAQISALELEAEPEEPEPEPRPLRQLTSSCLTN